MLISVFIYIIFLIVLIAFWYLEVKANDTSFSPVSFIYIFQGLVIVYGLLGYLLRVEFASQPSLKFLIMMILANAIILLGSILGGKIIIGGPSYEIPQKVIRPALVFCVGIGLIGTFKLLQPIGGLALLANLETLNYLEGHFFNSSWAILWQACIAGMFWVAISNRQMTRYDLFIIILLVFMISLRGAFLYLIMGTMYFVAGAMMQKNIASSISSIRLIFLIFPCVMFLTIIFTYASLNPLLAYYKLLPYTFGNFVNLQMLFDRGLELENVCHDYILGYRSLLVYIEKYTIFRFDYCSPEFPFRWQVIGEHVRGNTSSGFTQVATLGILYLPFLFVLGFVCSVILVNRFRSNIAAIALPIVYSASALMFASGGYLSSTRIFPSLLFIAPIFTLTFLVYKLKRLQV